MSNHKLFSQYHAVQDWSRKAAHKYLRRTGPFSWKREATLLLSVSMALMLGYLMVFNFASQAVLEFVDSCTSSLQIEFESAEIHAVPKALPRSLCECVAHSLLDKNGLVRLAMFNRHLLDPMALEPVTDNEEEACIDALWRPDVELAKRVSL